MHAPRGISLLPLPAGRRSRRIDSDARAARIPLLPVSAGRRKWAVHGDALAALVPLLPRRAGSNWLVDGDALAARILLIPFPAGCGWCGFSFVGGIGLNALYEVSSGFNGPLRQQDCAAVGVNEKLDAIAGLQPEMLP
jgi:hypothetical protein